MNDKIAETVARWDVPLHPQGWAEKDPQGAWVRFTDYEALAKRLAEANAKITQMTAGWGEDAVRVEELRAELASARTAAYIAGHYTGKTWSEDVVPVGEAVKSYLAALAKGETP